MKNFNFEGYSNFKMELNVLNVKKKYKFRPVTLKSTSLKSMKTIFLTVM